MGKAAWAIMKAKKSFNVHIYRRGLTVFILAMLINIVMVVFISHIYLHEPERDYYATSGIAPPVQLTPMFRPNMDSKPLLDPDPPTDNSARPVPQ